MTAGGLVVTKTPDQTVVNPGDIITYTVEVMNVGTATLTNFVVDDPMIPGLAPVPPATLLPRQSFIMTGTYVGSGGQPAVVGVERGDGDGDRSGRNDARLKTPTRRRWLCSKTRTRRWR